MLSKAEMTEAILPFAFGTQWACLGRGPSLRRDKPPGPAPPFTPAPGIPPTVDAMSREDVPWELLSIEEDW